MSAITTIASGDLISVSRTDLNTNFANLNTDKIETSTLDTDTTLAANSDAKIATQKAVKAYVDAGGNVNASTTTKGIVEEATQAEVNAGTAAGGTGARLFVNPSTLATIQAGITRLASDEKYGIGALANSVVKTYFNFQLLFELWTGAVVNDATTTRENWVRTSEVTIANGSAMADFVGTGAESLYVARWFYYGAAAAVTTNLTNIVILDFWARLPGSASGDIQMGFGESNVAAFQELYTASTYNRATFARSTAGALYASIAKAGVGASNTDISSSVTQTNWNNYRIELDLSNNALFYVNGVLLATLSGTNFPTSSAELYIGFGRSNTALFQVTAPNLSLEMNP